MDDRGQCPGNSGQERTQPVGVDRGLNEAKVGRLRPDPRDPLDDNAVSAYSDGGHEIHDQESRQKGPELRAQPQVQSWPCSEIRRVEPARLDHSPGVVQSEEGGERTTRSHSDERGP